MHTSEQKTLTGTQRYATLVIGDPSQAFADLSQLHSLNCQCCQSMLDAIKLAAEQDFKTIYVVMSSIGQRIDSTLQTLRRLTGAKIILLAQMHEEPIARKLTAHNTLLKKCADDYLICPVDLERSLVNADRTGVSQEQLQQLIARNDYKDRKIRELEKLATEDDLTGLKNRRYVREFLKQIMVQAKNQNLRATLLVFDIDNFKHYNDAYGHAVGDNVLRQAAIMMKRSCRQHDVIGRIGGDEFAVVFWDRPTDTNSKDSDHKNEQERRDAAMEHPQEAFFMAERFRKEVSSAELTFLGPKGKGSLTISGGLAAFPKDGCTVGNLFEQADKAMLEAKRSGKNRIFLVGKPL